MSNKEEIGQEHDSASSAVTEAERYTPTPDQYQTLVELLNAAVVIRDQSAAVLYASPYTEVLTGYPLQEMYRATGDFFLSIMHDEDKARYHRALQVSATGEAFDVRYRIFHHSGIEMWVETRLVPLTDEQGNTRGTLAITLDVTSQVRHQHLLEERNRDLRDFSYMLSHDLKGPIFTIKGMLGMLEEDHLASIPPAMKEILDHVKKATSRLEQLVGSVVEYSRLSFEEVQMTPVPLIVVCDDVRHDLEGECARVGATLEISAELPWVLGDQLKLYRIFANLIGNALKYRAPERPLRVEVQAAPSLSGRYVIIEIRDNGLGIPAEKHDLIFRPFKRAHRGPIEGSGIGLASVKKLTEILGGRISFTSKPGVGTTFSLSLRAAMAPEGK